MKRKTENWKSIRREEDRLTKMQKMVEIAESTKQRNLLKLRNEWNKKMETIWKIAEIKRRSEW
jgi:hypothetical protein